jgi:hypothetical protein
MLERGQRTNTSIAAATIVITKLLEGYTIDAKTKIAKPYSSTSNTIVKQLQTYTKEHVEGGRFTKIVH